MKKGFKKIVIEDAIDRLLDQGYTEKNKIIQEIMEKYGIDRPTVRRAIRDVKTAMLEKIQILQSDHYSLPE